MAKKRQEEPPKGSPAWMSTFSDLMNLLLCFFVLLFSMSTVDAQKFEAVAASFSQTFSIFEAGATAIGDGILISNGVSQLNELDKYINSTGKSADTDTQSDALEAYQAASMEQAEQMAENIEESLQEDHGEYNSDISVDFTSQYVSLNLNGAFCLIRAVIRSGKRQSRFWTRWDRYWNVMRTVRSRLKVIRTMCRSITARFANNDELSSFRALSVFDYFMSTTTLDPAKIKHSGRGEYVPVADNATPEGRAKTGVWRSKSIQNYLIMNKREF